MKTKKGFHVCDICGESIIVAEGIENIDFSRVISLNESAVFLWKKVEDGHEFTNDELVGYMTEEYEVEEAIARKDIEKLTADWLEAGIIVA